MDNPKGGSEPNPNGEVTDDTATPQLRDALVLNEAASASEVPPLSPAESSSNSNVATITRSLQCLSVAGDSDLLVGNEAIDITPQANLGTDASTSHALKPLEPLLDDETLSKGGENMPQSLRDSVTGEMLALGTSPSDVGPRLSPPPEANLEIEATAMTVQEVPGAALSEAQVEDRDIVPPAVIVSSLVLTTSLAGLKQQLQSTGPSALVPSDDFLTSVLLVSGEDVDVAAVVTSLLEDRAQELQQPLASLEEPQPVPVVGQTTVDESMREWLQRTSHEAQPSDQLVTIDSNEIGITVENVLERTVVHLVKEGSAAQVLGVTAGALLLAVHDTPTHLLSHFETVDALKRAPRPARLRFRPLPGDLLKDMRDRMQLLVVNNSSRDALASRLNYAQAPQPAPLPPAVASADRVQSTMRFSAPPLGLHNEPSAELTKISASVCEWACDQLQLVLLLYARALSSKAPQDASGRLPQQLAVVANILGNFNQALRRSVRSHRNAYSSPGSSSQAARLAALSELLNALVFGASPRSSPGSNPRSERQPTQLVDWCSNEMRPLLVPVIDVACALLEADCDLPLLYPTANSTEARGDDGDVPWVCFDATVEPVLSDGSAAALVVVVLRGLVLVEGDHAATLVATPITSSLASARSERARIAACRLTLELYPRAAASSPERLLLRGVATRLLVQSQEPNLRAAAVTAIQRLGKAANPLDLDWLVLLCDTAASDADTIVRRGGFEFSLRILHRLPDIFKRSRVTFEGQSEGDIELHLLRCKLVAIVQRLVEDPVASVRHAVAAHCASLCTLLGGGRLGDQWATWIVDTLHTFLRDDDGAVRAAAIDAVPFIFTLLRGFAHRYVYHAHFPSTGDNVTAVDLAAGEAESSRGLGGAPLAGDSPSNSVVPWSEVEAFIGKCYVQTGPSDAVVTMAVTSLKRTAGMLLPALLKLSHEAPEDVRCKVAAVAGRLLLQIADEFSLLALNGSGQGGDGDARKNAWKALRQDLTHDLVGPLLVTLLKDGHRPVLATLFTEMAGLPPTYTSLEPEGSTGGARRGFRPMSSIFGFCDEILSKAAWATSSTQRPPSSESNLSPAAGSNTRRWNTTEIMPEALLGKLAESIEGLSRDRDWRSRSVAVRGIPALAPFATSCGTQDRLAQVCVVLMSDKVNAVRMAAAEALCLTGLIQFSMPQSADVPSAMADWNEAIVIPQLYNLMQRPGARERQLALFMIQILVSLDAVTADVTIGVLVPLLLNAAQDPVSNVRLSVAKTLDFFMRSGASSSETWSSEAPVVGAEGLVGVLAGHMELKKCLESLSEDEDYDVHFHARKTMVTFATLPHHATSVDSTSAGAASKSKEDGAPDTSSVEALAVSASETATAQESTSGNTTALSPAPEVTSAAPETVVAPASSASSSSLSTPRTDTSVPLIESTSSATSIPETAIESTVEAPAPTIETTEPAISTPGVTSVGSIPEVPATDAEEAISAHESTVPTPPKVDTAAVAESTLDAASVPVVRNVEVVTESTLEPVPGTAVRDIAGTAALASPGQESDHPIDDLEPPSI